MRVVFVGSVPVTIMTAHQLIERGHEVIIIESDRQVIENLSDTIDCSFLHGDGNAGGTAFRAGFLRSPDMLPPAMMPR